LSEEGAGELLAGAVRDLIEEIATRDASAEALVEATRTVQEATARLRAESAGREITGLRGSLVNAWRYRFLSPVSGPLNPLAPPLVYGAVDEDAVAAEVRFGVAYQGPPGYAHGAFIAAVFDEILGTANMASGNPGMTVQLQVRYLRATPLHTPLRVTGRFTRREGRRIFASATMVAGGEITAEAEGVSAEITGERARRLFGEEAV
jgi:acyl-coenzyme A thioesterase PaaI-like protein